MEIEVPALDAEKLKEAAKESAMKGALAEIKDYYESYNSLYRKKIKEELDKQDFSYPITLPDIIAQINEGLTGEINRIAAHALSNTFLPMVNKYLLRIDSTVKFSEMLKEFIDSTGEESQEYYMCTISMNANYGWLTVKLACKDETIEFTLHKNNSEKDDQKSYKLLSMPRYNKKDEYHDEITIKSDGSIKVPYNKDILSNEFLLFAARMMMSDAPVIMDTEDFNDDLFEKECHC